MHYNFDEVIPREGTGSVKHDLKKALFHSESVIPMWVADMDFKTPDFVIGAIQKRLEHEILGYTHIKPSFYESIVNWNKRRHNWIIKPEWICFSPGVVPALNMLVMAFSSPGDSIIIQPPVYFPFFTAVKNHGRNLIMNPLAYRNGEYEMDFADLEAKIDNNTRMLILCSPHNPTGNVWSSEILLKLAEICLKNNILIVSDEIHADLVYRGYRHVPTASLSDELAANTITCMAPSKTFNIAGLSTSYLVIPNELYRKRYEKVLDEVHVGEGNIFGFVAAEAAYNHGDNWLNQAMEYLEDNRNFLIDFIEKHIPAIRVIIPQATYLVWLDCSGLGLEPDALKKFMIHEAGLGLNDGPQFGPGGEGFQRINIACPRQVLQEALKKLKGSVDKYFTK
ncbi:MAG: PatB family C-S lyase [Bacteroidales bacterium]|nr:PatB family C-S lyase [Bacteroidales bacterium]